MQSYSQYGEDVHLLRIFKNKTNGCCIEIGAYDGVTGSNTKLFEDIGWDCILIEPNPQLTPLIKQSRKSRLFTCALGDKPSEAQLHIAVGVETLSTLSPSNEHCERIKQEGGHLQTVTVPVRTLDSVLEESGIKPEGIDFISLDVEGFEEQVLAGFSINRWKPRVIIIEDNSLGRCHRIRNWMKDHGYLRCHRTGCNDHYAPKDDRELNTLSARIRDCLDVLDKKYGVNWKFRFLLRPLESFIRSTFRKSKASR